MGGVVMCRLLLGMVLPGGGAMRASNLQGSTAEKAFYKGREGGHLVLFYIIFYFSYLYNTSAGHNISLHY